MSITIGNRVITPRLLALLEAHGWCHIDGVPHSNDDAACQAILDTWDPLPDHRAERIAAIKAEGLARIQALMPAIDSFDTLELVREIWLSVAPAARQPTATLTSVINTYAAGRTAVAQIKAAASAAAIDAVTPAWP